MSTLLDEETIVLDALDFRVPCRGSKTDCETPATVAASCRACGQTVTLCDEHLSGYRQWFASQRALDRIVRCKGCGLHMFSFDSGISVVPL